MLLLFMLLFWLPPYDLGRSSFTAQVAQLEAFKIWLDFLRAFGSCPSTLL